MEPSKKKLSVRSRYKTFKLGFEGIANLIDFEPNAWFDIVAAIVVVIAGIEFNLASIEWIFIVFAIGFVLATVAASISIEFLASAPDLAEIPFIDVAKSLAAASVLISNLTAFIVGLIVFVPKLSVAA
jgi:Diacylglycerol kinase